ncbi:acyl-CoA esterase [compost metagenome]
MPGFVHSESLWVDTPGGRLFVRRWFPEAAKQPAKPPIVLFHDSLGCVELWRDFPQQLCLATGHEVIAYDRLGFGLSDAYPGTLPLHFIRDEAERFFALLKTQLQIERFVAFGHSVGGAMAATCAALYSQYCAAVITVAAQAFVEQKTLHGIEVAKAQFAQPGQLQRLEKYHADKAPWVLSAWTDTWLSQAFSGWTIENRIDLIQCPLLALHGEHDEYGSVSHPQRIAQLSRTSGEYRIIANCHHVPHREAPDVVLDAVVRLLQAAGGQ